MLSLLRVCLFVALFGIVAGPHSAAVFAQSDKQDKKQSGKSSGDKSSGDEEEKGPVVECNFCQNKGAKDCRRHSRKDREAEDDEVTLFCSHVITCQECAGTMLVDCSRCKNPEVEARLENQRKKNLAWLAARREKVDKLIKHEVMHLSSKNFDLTYDLKPMKVGRKRLSQHEHAHLYLQRLEDFRDLFMETMQISTRELPNRPEIYMWRDGRDQNIAALKFAGIGATGAGVKLMGAKTVFTMQYQKRYMKDDDDLHRNIVHNVAHLLLSNMEPSYWIGKLKGGWVDAGVAHYFEFKLDGICSNFCYQEQATNKGYKNGKWLVPVRKMVQLDDLLPFAETITKNTDQLEPKEHALCFSYVHFCLEGDLVEKDHGKAFCKLVRALKAKEPTRDGLRKAYGLTTFAFVEKWKEWVLKTYPTR
jgi:hypothetical protein